MIGFILSTYDRIDDFLVHLEILKFCDVPHVILPVCLKPKEELPDYWHETMDHFPHLQYVNGINFFKGTLLSLCAGLRKAKELGLKYVCYRNGDDWLLKHEFVKEVYEKINNNYWCAGYNWLTVNTYAEFALNELYISVDRFITSLEEAEDYFKNSSDRFICEIKIARWIKKVLKNDFTKFYRLPHREQEPGIGYEPETLPLVFSQKEMMMPCNMKELLKTNNRFFNEKWQLIGSHRNSQRLLYWHKIKNKVPYAHLLEKEKHFQRWLNHSFNNKDWNLVKMHLNNPKNLTMSKNKHLPFRIIKQRAT